MADDPRRLARQAGRCGVGSSGSPPVAHPDALRFRGTRHRGLRRPSVIGEDQLADAKVSANCPTQMFVGLPARLNVKVTNTGSQSWPAAFVRLDNLGSFVINRIEDSSGRPGDDVGHDAHRFGSLAAGATETYSYAVTPRDAGNPELELQVWGDTLDAIPIPRTRTSPSTPARTSRSTRRAPAGYAL